MLQKGFVLYYVIDYIADLKRKKNSPRLSAILPAETEVFQEAWKNLPARKLLRNQSAHMTSYITEYTAYYYAFM